MKLLIFFISKRKLRYKNISPILAKICVNIDLAINFAVINSTSEMELQYVSSRAWC